MRSLSRRGIVAALSVLAAAPAATGRALAQQAAGGKPPPAEAEPPQRQPPPPPPRRRYADSDRCGMGSAFEVVNLSASPIMEVYLRQSGGTGGWGEDRLGDRMLGTGERLPLDPGSQRVDVLLLRADGRAFLAMRQNPCAISQISLGADDQVAIR